MVFSVVEAEPECCKPHGIVDVHISTGKRRGFDA